MSDSKEITALRKAGKLKEALELGRQVMAVDPENMWNARAMGWVYYDHLKVEVSLIDEAERASKPIPRKAIEGVSRWLKEYTSLPREVPGMLHSKIMFQLVRIGRYLDLFLPFLAWAGDAWYQEEDLRQSSWEERFYAPLVVKVARECGAWLKAHPQELDKFSGFVEGQLLKAVSCARDDDKTWVNWSLALLQRRRGEIAQAAKTISPILKLKRTEFWVWSEAARIYQEEQPELGIACYCQALCCGAESKFLGKTHLELATLLVQQSESAWASKEILAAASIYDQEGWRHPIELENSLASEWFDPSAEGIDTIALRKEHATEALSLCFDEVVTVDATFLGMEDHPLGKKPRPTFAARWLDGYRPFIRGRRANQLIRKAKSGIPVHLIIGIDGERREIIDTLSRPEGCFWDSLNRCEGIITRIDPEKGSVRAYIAYEDYCWVSIGTENGQFDQLVPGMGIALRTHSNRAGKRHVSHWELCELPETPHIRIAYGPIEIRKSGIGFVGDIFIPPHLLESSMQAAPVRVVAVKELDRKKNQPGWKAVAITTNT